MTNNWFLSNTMHKPTIMTEKLATYSRKSYLRPQTDIQATKSSVIRQLKEQKLTLEHKYSLAK